MDEKAITKQQTAKLINVLHAESHWFKLMGSLENLPDKVWHIALQTKELQIAFYECRSNHHGPSLELQDQLQGLIDWVQDLRDVVVEAESHMNNMAITLGWEVDWDEYLETYQIDGPCYDEKSETTET